MLGSKSSDPSFLQGLFGWSSDKTSKVAEKAQPSPTTPAKSPRIITFRIGDELERRISRALRDKSESRSEFIRKAIERALRQDGEERLRLAHSAIQWG